MRALVAMWMLSSVACVHSYASAPPLEFAELDYGAWPVKTVALPQAGAKWKLGDSNHVAYVELNPEGKRTLVFMHGLGSYLKFWHYQLDAFAQQGYHVIAFDQLGYGKSDKPAEFPYSMDAMSEVLDELLGALGVEKAVLVGNSMGGEVALATAIRFPQRVEALVLASPAGFELFSSREKAWFKRAFNAGLIKSGSEYGVWGSVRYSNFSNWRPELEWLVEERVRLARGTQFDAYAYAQVRSVDGLTHNDFVRDSLAKISAPTLVIYGSEDKLIPNPYLHGGFVSRVMKDGAGRIKNAQLEGLKGCGHIVMMDCPDDFNAKATAFLGTLP